MSGLADRTGLEPATSAVTGQRSNQTELRPLGISIAGRKLQNYRYLLSAVLPAANREAVTTPSTRLYQRDAVITGCGDAVVTDCAVWRRDDQKRRRVPEEEARRARRDADNDC